MGNLKNNIDHYMKLKGIKMYSHLLVNIAHELGIKGQDAYKFANKEKSNFSKMLKDERPLKYEFIIPLEKIFGVSLARLLDEDSYKLPTEKIMCRLIKVSDIMHTLIIQNYIKKNSIFYLQRMENQSLLKQTNLEKHSLIM